MAGGYVLGVDGGGTKTRFALADVRGGLLESVERGCLNHENLPDGFTGVERELRGYLEGLRAGFGVGPGDIASAAIGLAGVDNGEQHAAVAGILRSLGLENAVVANDGFLGVKAGNPGGWGVSVNIGTGICVNGIDPTGAMLQINGVGDFSGDFSGGPMIAARVFRAAYDKCFRRGGDSSLADGVFSYFGLAGPEGLVDLIPRFSEQTVIRDMVGLFFRAAGEGDGLARGIMLDMIGECVKSLGGMLDRLSFPARGAPLVLSGSIHTKAACPDYFAAFDAALEEAFPGRFSRTVLGVEPVEGALRWAMELLGRDALGKARG